MVYVLSIYNKKEKYHRITVRGFSIPFLMLSWFLYRFLVTEVRLSGLHHLQHLHIQEKKLVYIIQMLLFLSFTAHF